MKFLEHEQGSREWLEFRQGILTGTTMGAALSEPRAKKDREAGVLSKGAETLLYTLVVQRMTELPAHFASPAMERGTALEPEARRLFVEQSGIQVEDCGMLLSDIEGFAVSPDGTDFKTCTIEIKCLKPDLHLKYADKQIVPSEYANQVIAPFVASDEVERVYFILYNPEVYLMPLEWWSIERPDGIEEKRERVRKFVALVNAKHEEKTF